jgi:hypothetical protein
VPYRYGWLNMKSIDGSSRRLELLDIGHAEAVEAGKRLFVTTFTIRVDSFMPVGEVLVYEAEYVTKILATINHHDFSVSNARKTTENLVIIPTEAP